MLYMVGGKVPEFTLERKGCFGGRLKGLGFGTKGMVNGRSMVDVRGYVGGNNRGRRTC